MRTALKKLRLGPASVPVALLALCIIGYVPFTHRLGFYWDDWPSMWYLHFLGINSFRDSFASDRPLLAGVFMITTRFLGEAPLNWQIFSIFTRWLASLLLWWTLSGIWPRNTSPVAWIAFLFAVYPGFTQQAIAVTYSNAFLVFCLFLFSLGAMIWAYRWPRWFWPLIILSWISSALVLFTVEYFFGLELLRPVLLWVLLAKPEDGNRSNLRRVLRHWLPYLVLLAIFVLWRLFLHETPRGHITIFAQLLSQPLSTPFSLAFTILQDLYEAAFLAWIRAFNFLPIADFDNTLIWTYIVTVLAALLLSAVYFAFLKERQLLTFSERPGSESAGGSGPGLSASAWGRQASLLGLFALLVGGWPFWITDLHLELIFPWDRFTIPMMVGACTLLVGLVNWLLRGRWPGLLILALLVGFAAGMHFRDRLYYRQDWVTQKSFFWELTWRAPGIQPGTLLMISELPFIYYSDNSLSAPLNWIYAPQQSTTRLPYMLLDIESRLGKTLPDFTPGTPINMDYRPASFQGSTNQALVMFYDPPRCLKIVDPERDKNLPYKPLYIPQALPLSNPGLIQTQAHPGAFPPAEIFGPEPRYWCYYFEKAELARQTGDWDEVARLGDEGLPLKKKFTKETATELLTFIEGYAHVGRWEKAIQLSSIFYDATDKAQGILCQTWYDIQQSTPLSSEQQSALAQSQQLYECKFP